MLNFSPHCHEQFMIHPQKDASWKASVGALFVIFRNQSWLFISGVQGQGSWDRLALSRDKDKNVGPLHVHRREQFNVYKEPSRVPTLSKW